MKIAIIHEYLERWGGAEQVLKALLEIFPEADVYTLTYKKEKIKNFIKLENVKASVLNRLPEFIKKRKRYLAALIPSVVENINFRDYDLVISSSSAFAKGIVARPKTLHICYCHSPMRFAWDWHLEYKKEQRKGFFTNLAIGLIGNYLRLWDYSSAQRVDYFIANSQNVAERIKKYYRRESKVIYPPVDIDAEIKNPSGDKPKESVKSLPKNYFLIISQLSPYKKIDLAVETFNKLELPLVLAGEGKDFKRLKKIARSNVKFLGFVSEEEKWQLLSGCEALIFSGEEDFGIAMAEAGAAGKPVLAFRRGGALEIIKEGETGEFFDNHSAEILAEGVKRIRENLNKYDPEKIRQAARKFSKERFKKEFKEHIDYLLSQPHL